MLPKLKTRSKLILRILLIMLISVLATIFYFTTTTVMTNLDLENYLNLQQTDTNELFEISSNNSLMLNMYAYEKFEETCLGNKNSNLLSFGKYYENNGVKCEIKDSKTILTNNSAEFVIRENPVSYINVMDGTVYYRDDLTRGIYSYQINTMETKLVVDSQCGQLVVSKNGISYVDFMCGSLVCIPFENGEMKTICEKDIKSFAIIGNKYVCLKENGDFGIVDQQGAFKNLTSNVDSFFCNGEILIQKKSNIYLLSNKNRIISSKMKLINSNIQGTPVGYFREDIFETEDNNLYVYKRFDVNSKKNILQLPRNSVVQGIYRINEDYIIAVITYTDDGYAMTYTRYIP